MGTTVFRGKKLAVAPASFLLLLEWGGGGGALGRFFCGEVPPISSLPSMYPPSINYLLE